MRVPKVSFAEFTVGSDDSTVYVFRWLILLVSARQQALDHQMYARFLVVLIFLLQKVVRDSVIDSLIGCPSL